MIGKVTYSKKYIQLGNVIWRPKKIISLMLLRSKTKQTIWCLMDKYFKNILLRDILLMYF